MLFFMMTTEPMGTGRARPQLSTVTKGSNHLLSAEGRLTESAPGGHSFPPFNVGKNVSSARQSRLGSVLDLGLDEIARLLSIIVRRKNAASRIGTLTVAPKHRGGELRVKNGCGNAGVVRRAAKKSSDAAEEFFSDATERMQHHLVPTVTTTFAVGFTAGALIGWLMRQK